MPTQVLVFISIVGGFLFGCYTCSTYYKPIFKQFSKEMHNQYLELLKKHGIYKEEEKKNAKRFRKSINRKVS